MQKFDMMQAITDTIAVIKAKPKLILAWALLQCALFVVIGLALLPVIILLAGDPENAAAGLSANLGVQAASNLGSLVSGLLLLPVFTAMGQSILGREVGKTWLGLRISVVEGRVFLCVIGIFAAIYAAILIGVLVGAIIVVPLYFVSEPLAISVGVVLFIALIVFCYWGMARAILIAPATVDMGRLAFVEGWRATKGRVWPLVGTYLLAALCMILVMFAFMAFLGVLAIPCVALWYAGGQQADYVPFWIVTAVCVLLGGFGFAVFRVVNFIMTTVPAFSVWKQIVATRESNDGRVDW